MLYSLMAEKIWAVFDGHPREGGQVKTFTTEAKAEAYAATIPNGKVLSGNIILREDGSASMALPMDEVDAAFPPS